MNKYVYLNIIRESKTLQLKICHKKWLKLKTRCIVNILYRYSKQSFCSQFVKMPDWSWYKYQCNDSLIKTNTILFYSNTNLPNTPLYLCLLDKYTTLVSISSQLTHSSQLSTMLFWALLFYDFQVFVITDQKANE